MQARSEKATWWWEGKEGRYHCQIELNWGFINVLNSGTYKYYRISSNLLFNKLEYKSLNEVSCYLNITVS